MMKKYLLFKTNSTPPTECLLNVSNVSSMRSGAAGPNTEINMFNFSLNQAADLVVQGALSAAQVDALFSKISDAMVKLGSTAWTETTVEVTGYLGEGLDDVVFLELKN